jgi:outer membrane immunogenic protein
MHPIAIVAAGLLSIAGLAGAAHAADLPARVYTKAPAMIPAVYDWSGVYIGINGGGGSSRNCYTVTTVAGAPVPPSSEGCHDATGGMVGGQLGYRWQTGGWVFGRSHGRLGRPEGNELEPHRDRSLHQPDQD